MNLMSQIRPQYREKTLGLNTLGIGFRGCAPSEGLPLMDIKFSISL